MFGRFALAGSSHSGISLAEASKTQFSDPVSRHATFRGVVGKSGEVVVGAPLYHRVTAA
jgi:hypothetical protein